MSTYIIGDIHGCYSEFLKMLDILNYNEDDEIICLGDYIDRGNQNYEMLKWLESSPDNFLLIRGNHEEEFIANINILSSLCHKMHLNDNSLDDTKLLYEKISELSQIKNSCFDYYTTINTLIYCNKIKLVTLIKWADIMKQMPYVYYKTINGMKIIITHAGYHKDNIYYYLYAREESYNKNSIVVAGHTPTIFSDMFSFQDGKIYKKHNKQLNSVYINIDCGCAYKNEYRNSKLACIRLEDMMEYYI